jgi:hypothetical protein
MAMDNKMVFLSVGRASTPQQEAFVRCIEAHLQAQGLTPRTVGRSAFSSSQPLKLVSELMRECRGTVIVAFERTFVEKGIEKRGGPDEAPFSGGILPTIWNQIEAAMAYVHGHPLLVICERDLKKEGLLEPNYDWYVQSCPLDASSLATPEFAAVFADWKRRVEQVGTPAVTGTASVAVEKLTLGQIVKSMTPAQLWAIGTTAVVALSGVAATAFQLGRAAGAIR